MQKKLTEAAEKDTKPTDAQSGSADQIYSTPAVAHAQASRALADPWASKAERSEALATLGRSAYYDNRISEAVLYLEQAFPLAADPQLQAEIALILAPALSKEGRSTEALELLKFASNTLTPEQEGKAHNQRGIILIELGRLPEAVEEFESARELHRSSGYLAAEGRALLNMAAAASEIGDQAKALTWYEEAWRLTTETDQPVMNAMIEGNLGYVSSRLGDFGAALSWYGRARSSFLNLGEVGLLVAVLEVDHATTLLDIGLNNEAFEAAEYARQSSVSGSNRMLEMQASLLLGEAQLRLHQYREAEHTLASVRESALELELKPWELRCDYLLLRIQVKDSELTDNIGTARVIELATGLRDAGWYREALRAIVLAAQAAFDRGDGRSAVDLIVGCSGFVGNRVDSIDLCQADALRGLIHGDFAAMEQALLLGFTEVDRQRRLLGSAELQVRLGHRVRELRTLALRGPIREANAYAVLVAHARGRVLRRGLTLSPAQDELRAQMRDSRVGLQEARLHCRETEELEQRIIHLERELLSEARSAGHEDDYDPKALCGLEGGVITITFLRHQDTVWAVRAEKELSLIEIGPAAPIESAARAQRAALRKMASRAAGGERPNRADAANRRLDQLLLAPLQLDSSVDVIVVPDLPVVGVSWAALPSLSGRSVTVAPSGQLVLDQEGPVHISSVGLLGGPGLLHMTEELAEVSALWKELRPSIAHKATVLDAQDGFAKCDLIHIASHGTFRPDNPFFSAIEFHDQVLTVLDMEEFEKMPSVVVLASCDSGAASEVGIDLIGTAEALLALGVRVVVAPAVIVDDLASRSFVVDVHTQLMAGMSVAAAVCSARQQALERGTPADVAAARVFQAYGGEAALRPVVIHRS